MFEENMKAEFTEKQKAMMLGALAQVGIEIEPAEVEVNEVDDTVIEVVLGKEGIYLWAGIESATSILGDGVIWKPYWQVGYGVTIPGSFWEPEDYDVVEDETHYSNLPAAIVALVQMLVKNRLEMWFEAQADEDMPELPGFPTYVELEV